MKRLFRALRRIPLLIYGTGLLILAILCGVALAAHAEDSDTTPSPTVTSTTTAASMVSAGGPVFQQFIAQYPYWYSPYAGGNQDALKFGDQLNVYVEAEDDAAITSITADASELGGAQDIPIPLLGDRSSTWHRYQVPITIASHANGLVHVRVTATDTNGNSSSLSQELKLDNTPPGMRIDSFSFVHTTTTPAMYDPMRISGWIDESESKLFMIDGYYTLLAEDGTPLLKGSYATRDNNFALAGLGPGGFSDYEIQIWLDRSGGFRIAEADYASFITITAVLRDGAGNDTTVTSAPIRIPRTGVTPPAPTGASNVLFLPGIESSRLYKNANGCISAVTDCISEQLWDPANDGDLNDLSLDARGKSVRSDVYTKEGDTINAVSIFKFYASFVDDLKALKNAGTIQDWEPVSYDWRLSLTDLLTNGTQHGNRIYYEEASSTPYIEQTLRRLAATSKTGKVTIVAHSNGGLIVKALLQKLGDTEASKLVDNVVLVGAPQSGAPQALAGLLHGYGSALPADWCTTWKIIGIFCGANASRAQTRTFAENAPMAYHLLPSSAYFDTVKDAKHPVVLFNNSVSNASERARYGTIIQNEDELADFAIAADGGRTKPAASDLSTPNIANTGLITYARSVHDQIDAWTPPPSIHLYEIGGWGDDTLSGIEYYDRQKTRDSKNGMVSQYRPMFVEDGDGVVPIPSALRMPTSANVARYWLNLASLALTSPLTPANHGTLLEMPAMREFIQNILAGHSENVPAQLTTTAPATLHPKKKLLFVLHGPATLSLSNGSHHTGPATDGTISEDIPGSSYGQLADVRYLLAAAGEPQHLAIAGIDTGTVSLDIQELTDDEVTSSATVANIPVTTSTSGELNITNGIDDASPLQIDENGDGTTDSSLQPEASSTTYYDLPDDSATSTEPTNDIPPATTGQTSGSMPTSNGTNPTVTTSHESTASKKKPPQLVLQGTGVPKKTTTSQKTSTKKIVATKKTATTTKSAPTPPAVPIAQTNAAAAVLAVQNLVYTVLNGILAIIKSLLALIVKMLS
jgi:pimeloyl-ACP methyl ester carboxylesterase